MPGDVPRAEEALALTSVFEVFSNPHAVGLTFKVGEADDVAGVTCIDCGGPIRVHEQVHGAAELRHTTCPTG